MTQSGILSTSSRKTQIKCFPIEFWLQKKNKQNKQTNKQTNKRKNRNDNLQSQLEYRHSPRGVHMSQKRWGELQARLDINHPIPTLHPDSCFQWIVAWYSWYLRAVSNRIGSKLHGTDWPSRLLDCDDPSGRESKANTKRSARDSPPSLGMHDCRRRSFRVLVVRFSADLGFF